MYFLLCLKRETVSENRRQEELWEMRVKGLQKAVQITFERCSEAWKRFRSWRRKTSLVRAWGAGPSRAWGFRMSLGTVVASFRNLLDANDRKFNPNWLGQQEILFIHVIKKFRGVH